METLIKLETAERNQQSATEDQFFNEIELLEIEHYLKIIPNYLSKNLTLNYELPNQKWQLQQTNGFKLFKKGAFPLF